MRMDYNWRHTCNFSVQAMQILLINSSTFATVITLYVICKIIYPSHYNTYPCGYSVLYQYTESFIVTFTLLCSSIAYWWCCYTSTVRAVSSSMSKLSRSLKKIGMHLVPQDMVTYFSNLGEFLLRKRVGTVMSIFHMQHIWMCKFWIWLALYLQFCLLHQILMSREVIVIMQNLLAIGSCKIY